MRRWLENASEYLRETGLSGEEVFDFGRECHHLTATPHTCGIKMKGVGREGGRKEGREGERQRGRERERKREEELVM